MIMKRMNKTEKNLQLVWEDLDAACGLIDNSFENLRSMSLLDDLKEEIAAIDFTAIVSLKNRIERLIEEKRT
jgi:aryl carrier-like protein